MDQLQISPETSQGLQNLSAKDKQELNQFVMAESQKAQIQGSMFSSPQTPEELTVAHVYSSHPCAQLHMLQ